MLSKQSGTADDEMASACARLRAARTQVDVERLIANVSSYRDPAVQAAIFAWLGAGSDDDQAICHRYFLLLHRRGHLDLATRRANIVPGRASTTTTLPTFHRRLLEIVGDRIPPPRRAVPRSSADTDGIAADLRSMGVAASLADLDSEPANASASWSVLTARCAGCGREQLVVRAHHLDIRVGSELLAVLDHNDAASVCQKCGCDVLDALDVWIQDGPTTGDALGALGTVVHVADWLSVYQPPAWGLDVEQWRVVLEVRSQLIAPAASEGMSFRSVAYSREQFRAQLALDGADTFRLACAALEFRLEHGLGPLAEIDADARRLAATGKWTPVRIDSPFPRNRRFGAVAIALLAEALGERQAHPARDRAFLSCQLATAWTAAGEYGPAQAAVARAKGALGEIPDHDERAGIEILVRGAEGDVLARLGRPEQAAELQLAALSLDADENGTVVQRLQFWRVAAKEALLDKQRGRLSEAILAFVVTTARLAALRDELSTDGGELELVVGYTLSGALANFAGALLELADDVAGGAEVGADLLEVVQSIDESSAANDVDVPTRMLRAAARLLEGALALSTRYECWTFAARQAWRGAELCRRGGSTSPPGARRRFLAMTRESALKAMDRDMIFASGLALAIDDARAGRVADAMSHVEVAARTWGERRIDAGGIVPSVEESRGCASLALRLAASGADSVRAVLVVESQKCVRLARSMSVGRLGRATRPRVPAPLAEQYELLRAQRANILLQVAEADPEQRPAWEADHRHVEAELDEVRRQVVALDPSFVRWSDARSVHLPGPTDLHRILSSLGPRTTLLGGFVDGDRLWSYAAWSGGGIVHAHDDWPTWRADIDALVKDFSSNTTPDTRRLERISMALLAPIRARLGELGAADRLVISQCAELGQVPFGALLFGEKRLIELVVVSHVPAVNVLAAIAGGADPARSALVLGAPYRAGPALPHALTEAWLIGDLCRERGIAVEQRVGSEASPAALVSLAPAADLVHVACHARWSRSEAYPASLDLAAEGDDNGRFTATRILDDLDARPGATFVLGACESARFDVDPDQDGGGLVPALFVAGAGTVVATLWTINDHDALDFHRAFYGHLLAGSVPCEALARTQREALRGDLGTALSMPKAWPAFVSYGR